MRYNLKAARKAANMTQEQVAAYLHISLRYYQFIESGHRTGGENLWYNLEKLLGVQYRILRQDLTCPPHGLKEGLNGDSN